MKAITEELRGHEFSASTISRINAQLEEHPYLIMDVRYEKAREEGVIPSRTG